MRITYTGDDYWEIEHGNVYFVMRKHGGDGPEYTIDQNYEGHEQQLMYRLGMSYEQLFETINNLIEGTNND